MFTRNTCRVWPPIIPIAVGVAACTSTPTPAPQSVAAVPVIGVAGSPATGTEAPAIAPVVVAVNAGNCPKDDRLDDLEDGDSVILAVEQRSGKWATYTDKLGSTIDPAPIATFAPETEGAEGTKYAVRFRGKTGLGNAYAGVGFWFTSDKTPYDASCCKGVAFRAKRGKSSIDSVRLKVGDVNTLPEGHTCKNCFNDFGVDLGFGLDWKPYRIAFENMRQSSGWGDQFPKISTGRLLQIQWQVSHPGFDFDIWIDDVRLFDCTSQ